MDQLGTSNASAPRELDAWGLALTTHSPGAARAYEQALLALLAHRADTPHQLDLALELDPELALVHVMRGFGLRLLAREDVLDDARRSLRRAEVSLDMRGGSARERMLCASLRAFCEHDQELAIELLASTLGAHPTCLLSLKLHHALCFMSGRAADMLQAAERCLAKLPRELPGASFAEGCYAFALEECGRLGEAERHARGALERCAQDPWSYHALVHVLTMRDQSADGLVLLRARGERFAATNNFAAHLSWHHALFAIAEGQGDEALSLYDVEVRPALARDYRDLANCASLLFRLERAGVDVGARWEPLAAWAAAREGDHLLSFADLHQLLALLGAGHLAGARAYVRALRGAALRRMDSAALLTRRLGLPMAEGMLALFSGEPTEALRKLATLALPACMLGGSHAQRELFQMLAVEAALASGDAGRTRALIAQQLEGRPGCTWAQRYAARSAAGQLAR